MGTFSHRNDGKNVQRQNPRKNPAARNLKIRDKSVLQKIDPKKGGFHWKKGKGPHPQDKIQHLDFTKDPRPLYYKTPPCAFYHKNVRSKAVFGP